MTLDYNVGKLFDYTIEFVQYRREWPCENSNAVNLSKEDRNGKSRPIYFSHKSDTLLTSCVPHTIKNT